MKDKNVASTNIETKSVTQNVAKALWFTLGTICLFAGAIGMVVPLLPTTPFLLASAGCFCKCSSRMHNWLMNNKYFGEYLKNYREGKGLPVKTKIFTLAFLWVTIGISTVFLLNRILSIQLVLPMQLVMTAVAIGVSIHILKLPTFEKSA